MRVQLREVPPSAALIRLSDALRGFAGLLVGRRFLARLESEVRQELGVRHAFLLSSGRAALAVTLRALGSLSPRREVVVPAYTCFSVPAAIERAGFRVVPCDVDATRLDFDRAALAKAVSSETLCVVPSHLFGIPSDMARITPLAQARGAFVLEDAAQALGMSIGGRPAGTLGDAGIFSFDRGKSVTCGSGGMIVTNSDVIGTAVHRVWREAPQVRVLRSIGDVLNVVAMAVFGHPGLYWIPAAVPWLGLGQTVFDPDFPIRRMSGAKAAILAAWRRRLEESGAVRAEAVACYRQHCRVPDFGPDAGPHIRLPFLASSREERNRIVCEARRRGLGIGTMYPTGINEIEGLKARFRAGTFPGARTVAERLLTLPTHQFATEDVRRAICRMIDHTLTKASLKHHTGAGEATRTTLVASERVEV